MGIFHSQVEIVNRTTRRLNVRYDGQDVELEPNYDAEGKAIEGVYNAIPEIAIPYALAQNPVMGSESVTDPSQFRSLVGIRIHDKAGVKTPKKSWHDCSYFDEQEWKTEKGNDCLTRVPLSEVLEDDPQVKSIAVRGRRTDVEQSTTTPFEVRVRS